MFKTLTNWLFDGSKISKIPDTKKDKEGKVIVEDIRKLPPQYLLSMFVGHGTINYYLNNYFNNVNLYYVSIDDILYFLKKCIIDFKVQRNQITYFKKSSTDELFDALREKLPQFKNNDIVLLCELVNNSNEKEQIYQTLGLKSPKKEKVKIGKKNKKINTSLESVTRENFSIIRSSP